MADYRKRRTSWKDITGELACMILHDIFVYTGDFPKHLQAIVSNYASRQTAKMFGKYKTFMHDGKLFIVRVE